MYILSPRRTDSFYQGLGRGVSVRYFLQKNPVKPGTQRAVLLRGEKAAFEAFLNHCAEASTVGRADALAVVTMMAGWIEARSAEGREVDFGPLGQTRLGIAGIFAEDEQSIRPDEWSLTISWQLTQRLKRRIDQAAKKTGLERRPRPNWGLNVVEVTDLMTHRRDAYTPGGLLEFRGARLKFNGEQADEGVFLRPAAGGAEVRADQYLGVFPKRVLAIVPAGVTGPQRLIVRRRTRPTQATPMEFRYATTLEPA